MVNLLYVIYTQIRSVSKIYVNVKLIKVYLFLFLSNSTTLLHVHHLTWGINLLISNVSFVASASMNSYVVGICQSDESETKDCMSRRKFLESSIYA
jgi:hypothetical protein